MPWTRIEQQREGLTHLPEWRIAADWSLGFHTKSKFTQIYLWTTCWAWDQATEIAPLSFFSIWPLNWDTLNFRKIWVWILNTLGSEAPWATGRWCDEPSREVCNHNELDLWFPTDPPPTFMLKSNEFSCRQYLLCPTQFHRALHCSKAHLSLQ